MSILIKLTQLSLDVRKTESDLGKANQEGIKRHLISLKVFTSESNNVNERSKNSRLRKRSQMQK